MILNRRMYPCLVRAVKAGIALLVVSVIYCYLTVCIVTRLGPARGEIIMQSLPRPSRSHPLVTLIYTSQTLQF